MKCRHCGSRSGELVVELGKQPISNAYLTQKMLMEPELIFPLEVWVCEMCWLVQTVDYVSRENLFQSNYPYFSSTSTSWLQHAKDYAEKKIIKKLDLRSEKSFVVEVASNDGYLLKNFVGKDIRSLGVEPTDAVADRAELIGVPTLRKFFGLTAAQSIAEQYGKADLIVANNVLAHVPDVTDFALGIDALLSSEGVATFEFPYIANLIQGKQFDTIYHEHFSYFSATSMSNIFQTCGLKIFDIEKLKTHGGSLRVYAKIWLEAQSRTSCV